MASKAELCEAIYTEEFAKDSNMDTMRKRCMDRIMAEIGMTYNGSSTYYSNAKKKIHPNEVASRVAKVMAKVEGNSGGDSQEIYSMVTVDAYKKAVDVKCFESKQSCLEECNRLNKHFVKGLQKRGEKLGVIDETWIAELDKEVAAEYLTA